MKKLGIGICSAWIAAGPSNVKSSDEIMPRASKSGQWKDFTVAARRERRRLRREK
jgi:hypothetical protein